MSRPKKDPVATVPVVAQVPGIKKSILLPGLFDILTETQSYPDIILKRFQHHAKIYGFERLETPPIEDLQLYKMYFGADNKIFDRIIQFETQGRTVALRPEILPSVLRAYAQHKMFELQMASKWMYMGAGLTMGPKSQFVTDYHFGVEVFGTFTHLTEAQTISSIWHLLQSLGLDSLSLEINHIGNPACQQNYQEALQGYLSGKKYDLCDNCIEHLTGRTLNVLRCSNLDCQTIVSDAPTILDFLEEASKKHFTSILEALDEVGIPYQLNPYYAGPDGISKTNCRITYQPKDSSEKIVISEGGYHDILMNRIGGKSWCCFGMQASISKITKAMEHAAIIIERQPNSEVCLVPLGDLAAKKSLRLFHDLTHAKVSVYDQFGDTGVKNQLKLAESFKTPIALIMGQKEALDETVILRDVKSGMQEMFSYDKIVDEVKKRLGK
jgi:histidyl-tRNA synthetase